MHNQDHARYFFSCTLAVLTILLFLRRKLTNTIKHIQTQTTTIMFPPQTLSMKRSTSADSFTSKAKLLPENFVPSPNDVMLGRGNAYVTRPGNKLFADICREHLMEYMDCSKRMDKSIVVARVLKQVLATGARFIKRVDGRWYQLRNEQAHDKTGHAIRDMLRIERQEMDTQQQQHQNPTKKKARSMPTHSSKTTNRLIVEPGDVTVTPLPMSFPLKKELSLSSIFNVDRQLDEDAVYCNNNQDVHHNNNHDNQHNHQQYHYQDKQPETTFDFDDTPLDSNRRRSTHVDDYQTVLELLNTSFSLVGDDILY